MASTPHNGFFDNPNFSDVVIKSGTQSWKAHKIILVRGSEYFRTMLCGPFEANKKEIELIDDFPAAVKAVLRFLYDLPYMLPTDPQRLLLSCHADIYAAAEKYSLPELKKSVAHEMDMLLQARKPKQDGLLPTVRIIWKSTLSTDSFARPVLAKYCAQNLRILKGNDEFIRVMLNTGLGADIALAALDISVNSEPKDNGQTAAPRPATPFTPLAMGSRTRRARGTG